MNSREDQLKAFDRLLTIMDELRLKCPWDKKQTMESLRLLTLEETYRAIDENSTGEIELYEFFQFFRDVRIPMTKTQIKR